MPDRLRQKSKWGAVRDKPTPGKRRCDACAKEHEVAGHTWLVIMSGHFVCDNNRCHTVMTNWLKEDTDAKKMDTRAARRAIQKEESRVGKAEIRRADTVAERQKHPSKTPGHLTYPQRGLT